MSQDEIFRARAEEILSINASIDALRHQRCEGNWEQHAGVIIEAFRELRPPPRRTAKFLHHKKGTKDAVTGHTTTGHQVQTSLPEDENSKTKVLFSTKDLFARVGQYKIHRVSADTLVIEHFWEQQMKDNNDGEEHVRFQLQTTDDNVTPRAFSRLEYELHRELHFWFVTKCAWRQYKTVTIDLYGRSEDNFDDGFTSFQMGSF